MDARPAGPRASRETPLGPVWVEARDGRITASGWGAVGAADDPLLSRALEELEAYFDGRLGRFTVPLELEGEGLGRQVMRAMAAIPFGRTRSYGEIARELGAPAQAVGQACGANPIPILVPCHRVVATGALGGFSAPGGVEAKAWLLRHEGALLL